MSGLIKAIIICLVAILLIVPIGVGVLNGISDSNNDSANNSSNGSNEEVDVALSLSDTEVAFNIGATKNLTASVAVESKSYIFLWDSSDKGVVSVRKSGEAQNVCEITAVNAGEATVTVSIIDVTKFKIIDSVSCNVTVIDTSINFSVDEVVISLDKSNTASVTAKAPDDGVIAWASEDESIATVDENGVITAHKAGQVYIVARSGDIEGKLLVKVYNSIFTLEPIKIVAAGADAHITVNGTIGEGAEWTSGDGRIATVDANGVVKGVKAGMTTITVTSPSDGYTTSCVVIVKKGDNEASDLESGRKAQAAQNPGKWYYLCESDIVTVDSIPNIDNGLVHANITGIGTSGANFFYLRYQVDDIGDVTYKTTIYIYSSVENAHLQIDGKDNYLKLGLNRIELEYTSSEMKAGAPFQYKFRSVGDFYILTTFEEISRVEKMVMSDEHVTLDTGLNKTFTLTATVPGQENPAIEWISSNESVATVVDGVVTAVGEGNTMITAMYGNLTATCMVTVTGTEPIQGEKLPSGNKSTVLSNPGIWHYYKDGKTALYTDTIMDADGNIHMGVESVDTAAKKYAYLRYQPEVAGTYKVTITIEFAGNDSSVIDISGGNVKATPVILNNGTNTFEFTFTSDNSNPFQMKIYAPGSYVVKVDMTQEVAE